MGELHPNSFEGRHDRDGMNLLRSRRSPCCHGDDLRIGQGLCLLHDAAHPEEILLFDFDSFACHLPPSLKAVDALRVACRRQVIRTNGDSVTVLLELRSLVVREWFVADESLVGKWSGDFVFPLGLSCWSVWLTVILDVQPLVQELSRNIREHSRTDPSGLPHANCFNEAFTTL